MNIIAFPQPEPTGDEIRQEIVEISTLLEHLLDQVADGANLDAPRDYPTRDFFLMGRLLLLMQKQHETRMLAICARLGVQ